MLRDLRTVALLVGALSLSCGGNAPAEPSASAGSPSADTPGKGDSPAKADTKGEAVEPLAAPAKPAVPAVPLVKANAALPGKAKVDGNLGFRVEDVAGLHAIEGTAVAADWGAPGSAEPSRTRDDDLLTAWTCTPTPEATCAVGLSLDAESEVTALRLFATAGPDWRDHRAHPRPKKIRVHTDSGFVDAQISDGAAHEYVIFAQPVKTRTVTLEILEVHKGSKDAEVHVAELEAFGKTGPARPPMKLDPATVFVSYETEAWAKKGESHTIRLAFLDTLQPDGTRRRLMRGTAVFGRADDRWILVEKLHGAGCDSVKGGYIVLDLDTRVPIPVGELGGAGGAVRRHDEGRGFLVDSPSEGPAGMRGLVFAAEDDAPKKLRFSTKGKLDEAGQRAAWGFTGAPLSRGGHTPADPPPGCKPGREASAKLDAIVDRERTPEIDPAAWLVCELDDGGTALVGRGDVCGSSFSLYHQAGDGTVTAAHAPDEHAARGLWLAKMPGVGLVVETTEKDGARGRLWQIDATGVHERFAGASLAVRPPAGCGDCARADFFATAPAEPAPAEPSEPTSGETVDAALPSVSPEPAEDTADEAAAGSGDGDEQ